MIVKPKRIVDKKLLESYREMPCAVCFRYGDVVAHHITTKGAGGDDVPNNLMPLCAFHHRMVHDKGNGYMIRMLKHFEQALLERGRTDIIERAKRFEKP